MGSEETLTIEAPDEVGDSESTVPAGEAPVAGGESEEEGGSAPKKRRSGSRRLALLFGAAALTAVTALAVVQGLKAADVRAEQRTTAEFLAAARQGAVNLTTINYAEADADVRRILDSSTGTFLTDFDTRSGPFIEEVKNAKAVTVGTVTEAGVESSDRDSARVLVAITVKTSNSAGAQDDPRRWRMRIDVQRVGDDVKVSNVEFVP